MGRKLSSKASKEKKVQRLTAALVIIAVAVIGTIILFTSHAATPYSSTYSANGILSGSATSTPGGSSTSGNAVRFGGGSTSTGGAAPFSAGVIDDNLAFDGGNQDAPASVVQETAEIWKAAGIKFVRTWVYASCDAASGDSGSADAATRWNQDLQYYMAEGIQPILVIACGMGANNGIGATYQYLQSTDFNTWFTGFVQTMATHGVNYFEIGNEVNINGNWDVCNGTGFSNTVASTSQIDTAADDYVNYLHDAYTVAHASDSNAYVISAGLSYDTGTSYCIVPSVTWAERMVTDNADEYMDGYGYHPYPPGTTTSAQAVADTVSEAKTGNYDYLKAQMGITNSVPDRPMWITEFGYCLTSVGSCGAGSISDTDAARAAQMANLYNGLKADGNIAAVNWYIDSSGGYSLETSGNGTGCSFGSTTMSGYAGRSLTDTMCAIKAYWNP